MKSGLKVWGETKGSTKIKPYLAFSSEINKGRNLINQLNNHAFLYKKLP